jgi:putative molybdopterin biosynthesis protein
VAVVAEPTRREVESVELRAWNREWGLVVPEGNPAGIDGFGDLVDEDHRLVNMDVGPLDVAGGGQPVEFGVDVADAERAELAGSLDGIEFTLKAHESPARRVLADRADAGVGLRATAEKLGLGFVPVGTQTVRVRANPDRVEKAGVEDLKAVLSGAEDVVAELPGYSL